MDNKNNREKILPLAPKPGDMIECPRSVGYSHYGIYAGEGNVIHATSDYATSGSVIKKEPLDKVAPGGNFKISNQDDKMKPRSIATILSDANNSIGQTMDYKPLTNNCETFASKMRYGTDKGYSEQGEKIRQNAAEAGQSFLNHAKDTHDHFGGK